MKARYIGGEGAPGSRETVVYGMTVKCGEVVEIPPQFHAKALASPMFEVVPDAPPPVAPAAPVEEAPSPSKPKKTARKESL